MTIATLVITDGRRECFARTLASLKQHWPGPRTQLVVVDDSADPAYAAHLDAVAAGNADIVVHNGRRLGFGGAVQVGWDAVALLDVDWVFHLEDDFEFTRTVPVASMMAVLEDNPHVAQMALRRQPWGSDAHLAGGYVEANRDAFTQHDGWFSHRLFFTTNPCLYRASLLRLGWPQGPESEGRFTHWLLTAGFDDVIGDDVAFGIWGSTDDDPWVTHIGAERTGTGY